MSQAGLLNEQYAQAPAGRVAGDSDPVDATAHDEEIERVPGTHVLFCIRP